MLTNKLLNPTQEYKEISTALFKAELVLEIHQAICKKNSYQNDELYVQDNAPPKPLCQEALQQLVADNNSTSAC